MKKIISLLKQPLWQFICLLVVIVVSSFAAMLVQNSGFQVRVENIVIGDTKEEEKYVSYNGKLAGVLYTPTDVYKEGKKAPVVVLTHGYLNNKEMQEIGAIELSRRGFIVLAIDQYDHGDSTWDSPGAFNFFSNSIWDAVKWVYDQPFTLKDSAGNAMVGASGHSMGGFSTEVAVMTNASYPVNYLVAALPVGADWRYVGITQANVATDAGKIASQTAIQNYIGSMSFGAISAHYDQFFFNNTSTNTVVYKDYVKDPVGIATLGQYETNAAGAVVAKETKAGVYYNVGGGQRVIYTPNETHPQDTWSLESGANTIEFFTKAFEFQLAKAGLGTLDTYGIAKDKTAQTWPVKELFTLISLLALVAIIFPLFTLLTTLPVFSSAKKDEEDDEEECHCCGEATTTSTTSTTSTTETGETVVMTEVEAAHDEPCKKNNATKNVLKWLIVALSTLISVRYLVPFMDKNVTELNGLSANLFELAGLVALIIVAVWIVSIFKPEYKSNALKVSLSGALVILTITVFRWVLKNGQLLTTNKWFGAPSVNTIAYWAICSACLIFLFTFITTPLFSDEHDTSSKYGLKTTWKGFGASALTGVAIAVVLLLIVFLVGVAFKVDFRFYTYAIQIFNSVQIVAALRYIPLFFVYYLAAGVSIYSNTKNMKGIVGDLWAIFLLAGPVVIFLLYQYGFLYATGTAAYPTFNLSAILCVGLVPSLVIAALVSRRAIKKTGSVWTAVIFNTVFLTVITLANTMVAQLQA